MAVIFPEIHHSNAQGVIRSMLRLKSRRYCHEISRTAFMREWDKLRRELNETEEYKTLRRRVIHRAQGKCEKCHQREGDQMCHRLAVAHRPDIALSLTNVYWGCGPCHSLDHPELKLIR